MRVFLKELVIETTRRCNMQCVHCLRGDAENINTKRCYIEKLMENVSEIGSITFSGGEPSLNPIVLKETLEIAKEKGINVNTIYVVTNAKTYSPELVEYMDLWFQYCMENAGEISMENAQWVIDNGFALTVSIDEFHDETDPWAVIKYNGLMYFRDDKEQSFYDKYNRPNGLILEGRAKDNFAIEQGTHFLKDYEYEFNYEEYDDIVEIDMVYLNSYGKVYPCCNFSYETQDAAVGDISIMKRPLLDIIMDEDVKYLPNEDCA